MTADEIPDWVWRMTPGSEHGAIFHRTWREDGDVPGLVAHYQDLVLDIAQVHGVSVARLARLHVAPVILAPYRRTGLYLDWVND